MPVNLKLDGNIQAPYITTNGTNLITVPATTGTMALTSDVTDYIKAWINFNGTGTPTARASFNVTSITDNNVGDYTINFTNALADANYAMVSSGQNTSAGGASSAVATNTTTTPTASACRVISAAGTGGNYDATYIGLAFLR